MTALRGSGPEPFSLDRMRRDIADQLGTPAELVGDDDDLLQLGLDSLGLMRLSARWSQAGAKVTFAELIEHRTLAQWWRLGRTAAPAGGDVALVDEAAPFPLATMQHAYWVGRTDGQVLGGVGAHFYNEFDGTGVRPDDLERAVHALIARHPMLRCRFAEDGTQQIMASGAWSGLTVRDLRCHAPQALGAELDRVREQLSHRRLDAGRGEVFDVSLSLLPGGATRVHVQIEMLVADAQSFRVLMADLASLYRRPEEPLAPLGYSYARYRAVASTIVAPERDDAIAYWRDRLPDLPGGPELPVRVDPAQIARPTVTRRHHWLSGAQRNELAQRCRDHGVTLSMVFLTTYAEVLAAWSANPRFLLNLPLYDRQPYHPDVADLVGDFTNLLLLEVDASEDVPFLVRVRQVQDQFARDVRHSAYSGVEVLRDQARVHTDRGSSAPVVFTSALSLGDLFSADVRACFGEPGWTMSQTPQVWLDCQVMERAGGLSFNWDAVEELFPPGVLDAMFAAYRRLLVWLSTVDWGESLPVLLPVEQAAVRAGVNGVVGGVSGGLLAGGLFEWAVREPGRVAAVEVDGSAVGYGELADRALRLAGLLVGLGVVAGDPVAVSLPRGVAQLVAVAGVLAAGGVYVPVGVEQPVLRRERIFARAGVSVVVGEDGWVVPAGVELVTLGQAAGHGGLSGPVSVGDDALAYVIFTSGSTGEPKGVEVSHRAAVNTIEDVCVRFGVGAGDRVLAVSALDFDLSVFDMFGMWSVGGAVVLVGEDIRRDARAWLNLVRTHHVTVWNSVPALLDMLLVAAGEGDLGALRVAMVSGDWVGLGLRDALVARQPGARLIALGGATEAAIWSNFFEVGEVGSGWRSIPYGVPLRNQMFRVVDRRGRDCPDWVAGELWIGGVGVAAGYRGDPERTAARFVTHAGLRWYRTGDLGRYWPDATLEFLGRSDFQVKVRGHRIELGEIEAALHAYPGVRDAVVVTVGGRSGQLAAGIVGAAVQLSGLPEFLAARLPSYMTPDRIVMLDRLPLSPNGKIDREALRRQLSIVDAPTDEPPLDGVETVIADLWRQLLEVDSVGRFDSFFTLGGDSLLATRLVEALRVRYGVDLPLRVLFERPAVSDLAEIVEKQLKDAGADAYEEGEL